MNNDQVLRYLQSDHFKNKYLSSELIITSLKNFQPFGERSILVEYYTENSILNQSRFEANDYFEYVSIVRKERLKNLFETNEINQTTSVGVHAK